jgi:hypothetical protein
MDKNIKRERVSTAPVSLGIHDAASSISKRRANEAAAFLQELDQHERRIRAEKERLMERAEHEKTKYNIAVNLGDQTTTGTKVARAFCSILAEWNYHNEGPKLLHALYLIRKLRAVVQAGVPLRESSDVELAFVRKVVSGITS